jgi:hypothetical protein
MTNNVLHVDDVTETTGNIEYMIASTRPEREAAFKLVYNSYLRAGLGRSNRFQMRVTPYHLLTTTDVFIARCAQEIIATVTLVGDGKLGLPMESVYMAEVESRREKRLKLGEISCLADRRRDFRRTLPVFTGLCRLMIQTARKRGMDETLVAVHPKHARFYQRFCAFEQIGQEAIYTAVRNHPAVAMSLNFAKLDQQGHANYEKFFAEPIPAEQLEPQPITRSENAFLRTMIDSSFCITPIPPVDHGTPPIAPTITTVGGAETA